MAIVEAKIKRWGNSMGIILPKSMLENDALKENDTVRVVILKNGSEVLKEMFGASRKKESGQQVKDRLRKELYDD